MSFCLKASALPKPLPLTDFPRSGEDVAIGDKKGNEVAFRSKDGEGEGAYRSRSRKNASTCSGLAVQLP